MKEKFMLFPINSNNLGIQMQYKLNTYIPNCEIEIKD